MTDDEGLFSRWSRRKRAVVEEASTPAPPPDEPNEEIAEPDSEEEEAALLEELGLPAPESLGEGDDFAPFMAKGVPEFLRRRALRVLWRSNPILANLDGLNDYDEDFNSPELTQKVLATGYQVGRGFVRSVTEALEGETPADDPVSEEKRAEPSAEVVAAEQEMIDTEHLAEKAVQPEPEPEEILRPRRMRFET